MGMYEVCAKCGHVGRYNYVDKTFAVIASSGKEAAAIVRDYPRVKHNHKDAIRYVEPIDSTRYAEIIAANAQDPYFFCHSVQEQRRMCNMNQDIRRDPEARRCVSERTKGYRGRPRETVKRESSAILLKQYYNEERKVC